MGSKKALYRRAILGRGQPFDCSEIKACIIPNKTVAAIAYMSLTMVTIPLINARQLTQSNDNKGF